MSWIIEIAGAAGLLLLVIGIGGLLNEKKNNGKKRENTQKSVYNPKEFRKPRT